MDQTNTTTTDINGIPVNPQNTDPADVPIETAQPSADPINTADPLAALLKAEKEKQERLMQASTNLQTEYKTTEQQHQRYPRNPFEPATN
jgi:hypothetical protein